MSGSNDNDHFYRDRAEVEMSSSPTPLKRAIEEVLQMQLSRGRQAVPGADEAYTYGLWHGTLDDSRPRRGVADAFDADEALMGARSRASGDCS